MSRVHLDPAAARPSPATRRYFFDLVSDQEIDVLTSVFERVLANLDDGDATKGSET
ncbi:MAG TPA: hypothetical protein VFI46_09485 [Jiangellaceae bacterium]|nr:hypothetical protein [Jiangellaceae bacterium]